MTPTGTQVGDQWGELERLAKAATPGPWRWEISLSARSVELCGGSPKSGFGAYDHSVMSFKRWGMGSAAPVFWSWDGHLGHPQRADEVAVPVEGREHHATWFRQIDHPNAGYIAAANPATVLELIAAARSVGTKGEARSETKTSIGPIRGEGERVIAALETSNSMYDGTSMEGMGTGSHLQARRDAAELIQPLYAHPPTSYGAAEDALKDPVTVHINMLRGGIAKPTPTAIGHLYRGADAVEVVSEVMRQNPDAFPSYGKGEELRALLQEVIDDRNAAWCQECSLVQEGGDLRNRILQALQSGSEPR